MFQSRPSKPPSRLPYPPPPPPPPLLDLPQSTSTHHPQSQRRFNHLHPKLQPFPVLVPSPQQASAPPPFTCQAKRKYQSSTSLEEIQLGNQLQRPSAGDYQRQLLSSKVNSRLSSLGPSLRHVVNLCSGNAQFSKLRPLLTRLTLSHWHRLPKLGADWLESATMRLPCLSQLSPGAPGPTLYQRTWCP